MVHRRPRRRSRLRHSQRSSSMVAAGTARSRAATIRSAPGVHFARMLGSLRLSASRAICSARSGDTPRATMRSTWLFGSGVRNCPHPYRYRWWFSGLVCSLVRNFPPRPHDHSVPFFRRHQVHEKFPGCSGPQCSLGGLPIGRADRAADARAEGRVNTHHHTRTPSGPARPWCAGWIGQWRAGREHHAGAGTARRAEPRDACR